MKRLDTIIVGGGLAGLVCGTTLAQAGKNIIILEASDKLGGHLTADEEPQARTYIKQFKLPEQSNLAASPIEELVNYIEASRGEIIYDAPVDRLSYSRQLGRWFVQTPWGEISTTSLVIAVPIENAYRLLKPVFGREQWFGEYFQDEPAARAITRTATSIHALFLAGAYTSPSSLGSVYDAMHSGRYIATTILDIKNTSPIEGVFET